MHLMYYLNGEGKRVYTLKKEAPDGQITYSAHPGKRPKLCPSSVPVWEGGFDTPSVVLRAISNCRQVIATRRDDWRVKPFAACTIPSLLSLKLSFLLTPPSYILPLAQQLAFPRTISFLSSD